ncbi:hypothetical protein RZS08_40400, partial [Arthrospira platensis SPKY1]|nr:hypothetical protein [Arthrospira platensis SPKY1]
MERRTRAWRRASPPRLVAAARRSACTAQQLLDQYPQLRRELAGCQGPFEHQLGLCAFARVMQGQPEPDQPAGFLGAFAQRNAEMCCRFLELLATLQQS